MHFWSEQYDEEGDGTSLATTHVSARRQTDGTNGMKSIATKIARITTARQLQMAKETCKLK